MQATYDLIKELCEFAPDLITVTYGAGGLNRDLSFQLSEYIRKNHDVRVCQHLTCVGHSSAEIDDIVQSLFARGIEMILALRGDPPVGQDPSSAELAFSCAAELVQALRKYSQVSIAVAGYPELHKDAKSRTADIEYLKRKIDAGGEVVYTQLFFDGELYFRFVEEAQKAGIFAPIVPGVLPIGNISQLERLTSLCGATIPPKLRIQLESIRGDSAAVVKVGTEYAMRQIEQLLAGGAPGVHIYTLNRADQIRAIVQALGLGGYERISSAT